MRGRSYTPSPPRGYGRRGRSPSPSPRGRYGRGGGRGGASDLPTSLLVRNLRHDCRPEDLRRPFEQFGALKDIYLPRDYYTGLEGSWFEYIERIIPSLEEFQVIFNLTLAREPRGFGFVQYSDPHDAAEAKHHMDGRVLLGRELTVVFAEENRKKPSDMRAREKPSRSRFRDRRRSPPRYSRSPPPHYGRSRSRSRDYISPPKRRTYSRSVSPQEKRYSRERSYSRSRSRSRSPIREPSRSPRSRSRTPPIRSRSPSPRRSKSLTPIRDEYPRETNGDRSPSR